MAEPDPRVQRGLDLVVSGHWYEAHEVLEDPWREAAGPDKHWLQALIHGAVALEHLRRGNPRGCWGQWQKCRARLEGLPDRFGGIDVAAWRDAWHDFATAIALEERSRRHVARQPLDGLPELPPESAWPVPALLSR